MRAARARCAVGLLGVGAGVAFAGASAAADLRVLLFETNGGASIAGARVTPDGAGLRVDGRRVGARWVAPGPGPHRAGEQWVRGTVAVERSGPGLRVVNSVP